jgi:malonyl-CoA/methylmalonyl-CoA synthetase
MSNGNFYSTFEASVGRDPSAVVFELEDGRTASRQWLHGQSARYANALCEFGCVAGERVAVQLDKSAHASRCTWPAFGPVSAICP